MEYKRQGLEKHMKNMPEYDLLGENTAFRYLVNTFVKQITDKGNWFTFCFKISDKQVDIMKTSGSSNCTLGSIIRDIYPETSYRSAIYKYLLRDYLCYYEAPTFKENNHTGYVSRYDKFLVTSNIRVVAEWLGISVEDAELAYGSRINEVYEDNECDMFQYLKLTETKNGERKVTRPRYDLDLSKSGTRVVPLFALEEGVNTLFEEASNTTCDVVFMKDAGAERTMNITFSLQEIRKIYKDNDFISRGVQGMYDGDFIKNPYLERGYIKVFEMGSSVYDSPLRSINYARIISFKQGDPDITFINIDLENVEESFMKGIDSPKVKLPEVVAMLREFNVASKYPDNNCGRTELENWVSGQKTLLGTVFQRNLALFMLANPQWFSEYNGSPESYSGEVNDIEDSVKQFDFESEFLDME